MRTLLSGLLTLLFLLGSNFCTGDKNNDGEQNHSIFVASWNLENLFDTKDDIDKNDEWFTPDSEIIYTEERMNKKIENLAHIISLMNDRKGPDILGVQEVEHKTLLEELIKKVKSKKQYDIVHIESPDMRGIDNALIYNPDILNFKKSEGITVDLENEQTTRLILYVELEFNSIPLHIFVNHWPSRREGLKETEIRRIKASETLLNRINAIPDKEKSNILIMGDFNDMPSNISISKTLGAIDFDCNSGPIHEYKFLNLSYGKFERGEGTYKYRDHWNMLDQIIVSNSLFNGNSIDYECNSFNIFKPDIMVEKEGKYAGTPFPTYGGRKYLGGYSDHFPVTANFKLLK